MENFVAESNTSSASNGRQQVAWPRIFLFIVAPLSVLLLVVISLNSVIIHQKGSESVLTQSISEQLDLDQRFPGYFLSPEERDFLEEGLHRFTDVYESVGEAKVPLKPLNLAVDVPQVCCFSNQTYSAFPTWMVDVNNTMRKIATFKNKRQVFLNETCKAKENCNTCSCITSKFYVKAVYVSGGNYDLGRFEVGGCCKCIGLG